MTYTSTNFRLGPESTPSLVKKLIFITSGTSLLSALLTNFFNYRLGIPGPEEWFSLSWWGMSHYLWWQPVSFLFVHHTGYQGINVGFFILLLFNMYILWVMGSDVYHRVGKAPFLRFYFVTGIVAGLLTFLLMPITRQFGIVSGATPSILSILVVWTLVYPENELLLFFLIPVKAKWLTTGILGALLLTTLSSLNLVNFSIGF
ncbi:MAG: rhomboid family intramembrane serine protease, partial [Waddliaceae bacterium]